MDLGTLSGIGTLILLLAFVGLCIWAFSPRQRRRWDESAQLPFLDEDAARRRRAARDEGDRHE